MTSPNKSASGFIRCADGATIDKRAAGSTDGPFSYTPIRAQLGGDFGTVLDFLIQHFCQEEGEL